MFDIPGMTPQARSRCRPYGRSRRRRALARRRRQRDLGGGHDQDGSRAPPRAVVALQSGLRGGAASGPPPTPVDVYGPVLEPGEHALLSTESTTAGFAAPMRSIHRCR